MIFFLAPVALASEKGWVCQSKPADGGSSGALLKFIKKGNTFEVDGTSNYLIVNDTKNGTVMIRSNADPKYSGTTMIAAHTYIINKETNRYISSNLTFSGSSNDQGICLPL